MKKVYYNITVKTKNDGKEGVSMITGGDTIEKALQDGFRNGTYYMGLGYHVWLTNLRGYCTNCCGSGNIRKGIRTMKYVKCPDCKGQGETELLMGDIVLTKSDNINITIV